MEISDGPVAATAVVRAHWRRRLGRLLAILDAWVVILAIAVAYFTRLQLGEAGLVQRFGLEVPLAVAILPLWLVILYAFGCYRPEYQNQSGESFRRFLAGTTVAVLVLGFLSFAFRLEVPRLFVLLLWLLVLFLGWIVRGGIRRRLMQLRRDGKLLQNVLVVGADEEAVEVVRAMEAESAAGYRVVGFVDDRVPTGYDVAGYPVLGGTDGLLDLAAEHHAGLVVVSTAATEPGTLQDVTLALEGSPVDLAVAPSLFQVVTRRVTVESVGNVPILHVAQIRLERGRATLKRALDLVVATLLTTVTLPLLLVVPIVIRLSDRGPVFYRQRRVGKDGREFWMLKFRTMVPDADVRIHEVAHLNEVGGQFFKIREDPRITRVGRFLRKWSIDELPQLVNVLRGEMAMVGPRPPLPEEVADYEPWHLRRLRVRPGITGIWQVSGRSEVPFDEAVRLDLFYIENWSLGYDLYLLGRTVAAVVGRHGAY